MLAGALIVMTAALIVTATLAAVVAIVVGLVVWSLPRLRPRTDAIAGVTGATRPRRRPCRSSAAGA